MANKEVNKGSNEVEEKGPKKYGSQEPKAKEVSKMVVKRCFLLAAM